MLSTPRNQRDLLIALVTVEEERATDFVMFPAVAPCGQRLVEFMEMINEASVAGGEGIGLEPIGPPSKCVFFSFQEQQLPFDVLIEEIPKPGVLIVLRSSARESPQSDEFDSLLVTTIRMKLGTETLFREHMAGYGPTFDPISICRLDVFISYSSDDVVLAEDLMRSMTESGLRCFLAKNIQAGKLWREEIRSALHSSRVVVLLLTSSSIASKWVMCEMGAFWALGKPIVPAVMSNDLNDIPEVISEHQCWPIEDAADRTEFLMQIWRLCRPYS
jgi:hypothetical protein